MSPDAQNSISFKIGDTFYQNVRVEQAYKGNYHLLCSANGVQQKFVISKSKTEYAVIEHIGCDHLTQEQLRSLVETCLVKCQNHL